MRIVWTKFARDDIKTIRAYIARDSAYYAACVSQRMIDFIGRLRQFPELGQVIPEFDRYIVRELVVQNYRVLYTVEKDLIVILAVVHAARDVDSITPPERL